MVIRIANLKQSFSYRELFTYAVNQLITKPSFIKVYVKTSASYLFVRG